MRFYYTRSGWSGTYDNCCSNEKYFCFLHSEKLSDVMMLNDAEIKVDANITSFSLPVMEHFYTLQGEGFHQGKAAYFIRLGGCDVGCTWCDVKESWDAEKHPKMEIKNLSLEVSKTPARIVVITGGEPLLYNL